MDRPLYYRFVFKPSDGSVEISHNAEGHPADVPYHSELADERDTYHGYAYRIGKGWRLTDWEHQPVSDPFVVSQVLRRLRQEEGFTLPHSDLDDWSEQPDPNYDQFHYGLPVDREGHK